MCVAKSERAKNLPQTCVIRPKSKTKDFKLGEYVIKERKKTFFFFLFFYLNLSRFVLYTKGVSQIAIICLYFRFVEKKGGFSDSPKCVSNVTNAARGRVINNLHNSEGKRKL